jgi:hypothetical protein
MRNVGLTDSTSALRWRLADHLSRVLRLLGGAEGTSGRSMPSTASQRYLGVSDDRCQPQKPAHCPIGQGLEAGGSCPAGRHPLRVNSPWALSAKPDVLTACLASQRYLAGACDSPCRASGRASPQRRIHLLIRRSKVGARRAAALCFLTPPSEPDVRLSPHPALQGWATSREGSHRLFVHRSSSCHERHQGFPR